MQFFIRWSPAPGQGGYVANSNRCPYVRHPADPKVKTWISRKNAERFLSRKSLNWIAQCTIVEAPSFWRKRDPQSLAEWDALAAFFNEPSGAVLQEQVRLADLLLAKIFDEERQAGV
jgi:hypothetical protein